MSRLVHHIRRSSLTLPNKSHHTTIFHRRHWHNTLSSSSPLIQTSQQEDAVNVRRRRISYNTTTYRGFSSNNLESWWKQHASELKQTPRFNNGDRAILLPQSDKKEDIHPVEHLVEWVWNMVNVPKGEFLMLLLYDKWSYMFVWWLYFHPENDLIEGPIISTHGCL